jgi:uncharacterized membrane protein YkoI
MNHQDIEQLFSRARSVRLSEEAKASGRAVLLARMSSATEPAPEFARFSWLGASWLRAGSFASLLLLIGGTAWAAEGALPGDPLYTWKTKVNEPTRLVFLPTPVARAEWSVELLSRRLKEAETLASSGQLNSETQAFLEEKLNQERNRADAYSQSGGDENCDEIEAEIKLRIEGAQYIEVRDDAGRLRIRVREEHEEEESEQVKRRENEVRHEDGWIEETELHEEQHESDDDEDSAMQASRSLKTETKESGSINKSAETKTGSTSPKSTVTTSGSNKDQVSAQADDGDEDEQGEDSAANEEEELISESTARSKALAAVPGAVKESELKDEDEDLVWEVKIRRSSDNEEVKVVVDAQSGNIKGIED